MTKTQVLELLNSSKSPEDWRNNCDKIKKAFKGQYPEFWFQDVMQSGLMRRVLNRVGSDPDFHIYANGKTITIRNEGVK